MTLNGGLQILLFFAVVLAVTKPLGIFMAKVFSRECTFLDPALRPVERLLYKLTGVDEEHEMRWTEYAIAMLLFSAVSMLFLYLLQRVQQGVVHNLKPYDTAKIVEPQQVQKVGQDGKPVVGPDGKPVMDTLTDQVIAQGPVASQEAIKMLGTNGGGFFGANSAHPFENPTPLTNFLEMLAIFAIPAGLTFTLGKMSGFPKHVWAVWSAMAALFLAG